MSDENKDLELSKFKKREVTSFVGRELLYDYLTDTLDEDRKKAVAEHIKFSRDAQLDLQKIEAGRTYAQGLSHTEVADLVVDKVRVPSSYIEVLMQKTQFDRWPVGFRWGLEAIAVVSVIVALLSVAPWDKMLQWTTTGSVERVTLAEVAKEKSQKLEVDVPKEKAEFVDEGIAANTQTIDAVTKSVVSAVKAPVAVETASKTASSAPAVKPAQTVVELPRGVPAAQSGGFLYRGALSIKGLNMAGQKITERISSLGGRKAGDVDLGWQKSPTSLYYHFTIPEAKYPELMTYLAPFGRLRIDKEKHPRVMPDGIIRLIITVEEADK